MAIKLYACAKCNKLFQNEDDAISCERSHNDVLGCLGYYKFGDQYPHRIRLTFMDGTTRGYQILPTGIDQEWRERNIEPRYGKNKKG